MAVDPSLTCSGWALFSLLDCTIIGLGKIKALGPEHPMSYRLSDLQGRLGTLFEKLKLGSGDILVCEGETTMRDPRAAFKVEQVRCIFETLARNISLEVPGRINPRTVQNEVLALKGKQPLRAIVKSVAYNTAYRLYQRDFARLGIANSAGELKAHPDIVDAVLLGGMAASRVQMAIRTEQDLSELFNSKARRKGSRTAWGKGGDNSFGWTESELKKVVGVD